MKISKYYFKPEIFEISLLSHIYCRVSSGTDSGPMLERYPGIPIDVCARVYLEDTLWLRLQLAHHYLNELIKPPSNYLSYAERRILAQRTNSSLKRAFSPSSDTFHVALLIYLLSLRFTLLHARACVDSGVILSRLEKISLICGRQSDCLKIVKSVKIKKN